MTTPTTGAVTQREPALLGQTVVVIGGSAPGFRDPGLAALSGS